MRAGNVVAALGLSALIGGMLFFGAVMAPLVFTKLPPDVAGAFIRAAFPRYYGYMVATSVIAAFGFALRRQFLSALAMLAITVATLWSWFWLIPELDALRAAGKMAAFDRGHTLSVWINGIELLMALAVLVRSALRRQP